MVQLAPLPPTTQYNQSGVKIKIETLIGITIVRADHSAIFRFWIKARVGPKNQTPKTSQKKLKPPPKSVFFSSFFLEICFFNSPC